MPRTAPVLTGPSSSAHFTPNSDQDPETGRCFAWTPWGLWLGIICYPVTVPRKMHKQSWEQNPDSQTPMWMLKPVGKAATLPRMHLLCGPAIQQHIAERKQAVPSSPLRRLDALQEMEGGNNDTKDNSNPVCHFLAASNRCFRLNMFAVTERLSVLTFQRSCCAGVSAD